MTITHKLSIDLAQWDKPAQIDAVQDDCGRVLSLMLHTNGIPWTIPDGISATVRYRKADGVGGEYDTLPDGTCAWSAQDNVLTVALAPQVLTAAGETCLSVLLAEGDAAVSTFDILLHVQPGVHTRIAKSDRYVNVSAQDATTDDLNAIGTKIISGKITSIVLLGDSITDGAGGTGYNGSYSGEPSTNSLGYCWANVFKKFAEERYGVTVTNLGMYGTQMVTQKDTALEHITEKDFVIWLTGTNDRNWYESYQARIRSYIAAVKEKCAGMLVISSIPATEADENSHTANMQKMDEIVRTAAAGHVPYFSMYQAFIQYCQQQGVALADCFADHVHPNDLGYYIMFRLLCRKLGLPLDAYTNYQCDAAWWNPYAGEEVLAQNVSYQDDYTTAFGLGSSVAPGVYMNGYDADTVTTALSGTHITRVDLLVHTAGAVTFGTVDLNTVGQQKPVYVQSKTVEVTEAGIVLMELDLDIGANETLAVQYSTDTGRLMFNVGSNSEESGMKFWTAGNFESGSVQCIRLFGTIYGYGANAEALLLDGTDDASTTA